MSKLDQDSPRSPGRPKGAKSRTSREAQQAILDSLARRDAECIKNGKGHYLDTLDDKVFGMLVARVLPKDMKIEVDGALTWAAYVAQIAAARLERLEASLLPPAAPVLDVVPMVIEPAQASTEQPQATTPTAGHPHPTLEGPEEASE